MCTGSKGDIPTTLLAVTMKSWADLFEDEETGSVLSEFMWLVMHNEQIGPRLTDEGSLSPPSLKMVSGVSGQGCSISRQDCEANRAKSVFGYPLTSCLGDPFFAWIPPNSAFKPKEPSNLFSTLTQTYVLRRAQCQPLLSCCG